MSDRPRLPHLKPSEMTAEQKSFYDDVIENMGCPDSPHIWMLEEGQLNGPFTSMFHYPEIGYLLYKLQLKIVKQNIIPKKIIEVFILTIVSELEAAYGMYAHSLLGEDAGVDKEICEAILQKITPDISDPQTLAAYKLAKQLNIPGVVPDNIYVTSIGFFGEAGYNILINTAAFFKYIGTLMNAYDEPVPITNI